MSTHIYTMADPEYVPFIMAYTSAVWGERPDYPEDLNGIFLLDDWHYVVVNGRAQGHFSKRRWAFDQYRSSRKQASR